LLVTILDILQPPVFVPVFGEQAGRTLQPGQRL